MHAIQQNRISQFDVVTATPGSVVFLGDSLTEGGLWSEWFPRVLTSNRGVSGETTGQILQRLASAIDHPRAVFILAGTNDLSAGAKPRDIASRMAKMVAEVTRRAPHRPVFVQSVIPRQARFATEIRDLNRRLQAMASAAANVEYIDLWPALATPGLALNPLFTKDSLHLNGLGYAAWVDTIRPLVVEAATSSRPIAIEDKNPLHPDGEAVL